MMVSCSNNRYCIDIIIVITDLYSKTELVCMLVDEMLIVVVEIEIG